MDLSRRDLMRATSAVAAAFGLRASGLLGVDNEAQAAETGPSVVWLQAQACSGCSVSFLNSLYYATAADLLQYTLDVNYHPELMAGSGNTGPASAVAAAQAAYSKPGYVLVVEGSIPTAASGRYCYLWPGTTALKGVQDFAANAGFVIAVGTCACYGGIPGASPNPTATKPIRSIVTTKPVINIPGCPASPDWLVGTISYILKNGKAPALDGSGRPIGSGASFFAKTVHSQCPYNEDNGGNDDKCLHDLGCKGPETHCDCPTRKWNTGAAGAVGVNWCIGAGRPNGMPCIGCTEPNFPDGMSPFYSGEGGSVDDRLQSTTAQQPASQPAADVQTDIVAPRETIAEPTQYEKYQAYQKRLAEKKAQQKQSQQLRQQALGRGKAVKRKPAGGNDLDILSNGKGG